MKKKINFSLVAIAILAIVATLLGTTVTYYGLLQKQVRKDLAISANLLKDTHYFEVETANIEEMDLSTDITELRVTWIDGDGDVLYDNDVNSESLTNHMDRPEIQDAINYRVGETVRHSDTMDKDTFYYAILLDNGTVLRVATNVENLWSMFMSVSLIITLIIIIIAVICVLISRALTRQMIKPIELMAQNLETNDYYPAYKELEPFYYMIRRQHADILSAAKARQDFTANVSHELKTPLTAISGYAQLLEGEMIDPNTQNHFYEEIRKNADRLIALINDIIRLSELDRNDGEDSFEKVNLFDIGQESMENLLVNAKQRDIKLVFNGESCPLQGNKYMLKELIENLVQNAIRYNNPGGEVNVVIKNENERPVLIVKDNGIGIPVEDQERIFERFYRVDKSRSKETGGTGLGLAIVKHIVEIHDAKIELESQVGRGTTIKVIF